MCLLFLLHGSCLLLSVLLTFSDNLYCQMILSVLLKRQSEVCALLCVQPSLNESVHEIDVIVGLLHDHRVLLSVERRNFAVLLFECPLMNI